MSGDPAIAVDGLVREFGDGVRAVDGVSLEVGAGEIYGFLGPNGAGKSTTVHILTTLLPPSAGSARVAGHDVVREAPAVRAAVGAALQEAALDPFLTAREHLRLQATLHGLSKAEREPRAQQLLERMGLTEAADRKVSTYSGGMRRRLDLALALVHRPKTLFLDEPTTGLDLQSRMTLWDEVALLAREHGVTIFLTTQYLEEADALADRIAIIDRGRIVADGRPAALKREIGYATVRVTPEDPAQRPAVAAVLGRFGDSVGESDGVEAVGRIRSSVALAEIVRALDAEGLDVAHLQLDAPTLDDVFLAKTGRWLEGGANGAVAPVT